MLLDLLSLFFPPAPPVIVVIGSVATMDDAVYSAALSEAQLNQCALSDMLAYNVALSELPL